MLDPPIHEQTNERFRHLHRRNQHLQHASHDLLLRRLQPPRSRKRYPRCSLVRRQRRLRTNLAHPHHRLLCLRLLLQRPRNTLSTYA